jgi:Autotransporter beta-domain
MAAPVSAWLYGANLVGNADRASTFGIDIHTQTVTGAFDVTKIGIFTTTDALTFIGTGSHTWSQTHNFAPPDFEGSIPSTSGTLSYLNGGFSADFTALLSWTRTSVKNAPVLIVAPPDSSSISYTGNAQYRFEFPYTVWFEPSAGVTYTELYTSNFGTKLGDTTEVHGGGRVGFETKWMGYTIQPTLSGFVYKVVDSSFSGLVGPGIPAVAAIQSNLGGRGAGKITVIWTPQFSSYLEVHGSGTAPTDQRFALIPNPSVQSYGVQGGLRYTW